LDVLLVLLIIFMVITPSKPSRFEAKVPAEPKDEDKNVILKPNPNTLIVFINREGAKLRLNQDDIGDVSDTAPLTAKLEEVFKDRESRGVLREGTNEVEKTVFIKAPKSVKYGDVVKVIDAAKLAGAQPIGLQIDDLEQ
jgi:biopolymer transport protein ExbD